ncbi:MAG: hypothetical protein WD206_00295 [Actinomycetota bacterium]
MPLTFPNGTHAVAVLPAAETVGTLAEPTVSYLYKRDRSPRYVIGFTPHRPRIVRRSRDEVVDRLRTRNGHLATVWDVDDDPGDAWDVAFALLVRTRGWTVEVQVRPGNEGARVARHLGVWTTPRGFPRVHLGGPFRLSDESGEGGGSAIGLHFPAGWVDLSVGESCAGLPERRCDGANDEAVAATVYGFERSDAQVLRLRTSIRRVRAPR